MEIRVEEEEGHRGIDVRIVSAPADPMVPRIVASIQASQLRLVGYAPDGTIGKLFVTLDTVLFIDTSERRAFIHTSGGEVLESPMRLFELEEALTGTEFIRASRQMLVNFDHVVAIRPEMGARLVLTLDSGDKVLVSRGYAADIKQKIGAVQNHVKGA